MHVCEGGKAQHLLLCWRVHAGYHVQPGQQPTEMLLCISWAPHAPLCWQVLALLTAALQQHPVPEVAAAASVVLQPHADDHSDKALQAAYGSAQAIACQVSGL